MEIDREWYSRAWEHWHKWIVLYIYKRQKIYVQCHKIITIGTFNTGLIMEIKTITAVNAYNILKTIKVASLSDSSAISVWKTIRQLRPIADDYEVQKDQVVKSMKDGEFEKMSERLTNAKTREQKVLNGEYKLTKKDEKDVEEINKYFNSFNSKLNKYFNELENKMIDIDVVKIPSDEIIRVLKGDDDTFQSLEAIDFLID